MRITFRQLELFVAIAKYSNLTQAADSLYISQSAASMALAQLERQLDRQLFERIGKKLLLNNHGKLLLPKAVEVLTRIGEIEQVTKQSATKLTGELKIGASTTIGNYVLPKAISNFIKKYDEVNLQLVVDNTQRIINEVLQFNIDVGFIEGYCHHPEIHVGKFMQDELVVIASPKHSLAGKRQLAWSDLAQAEWILREKGSGTREVFEKAIYNKIDNIKMLAELGSSEAIKQVVADGLGISCLSKLSLTSELKLKKIVILPVNLNIKRYFYCLLHHKKYQTPILQEFLQVNVKDI